MACLNEHGDDPPQRRRRGRRRRPPGEAAYRRPPHSAHPAFVRDEHQRPHEHPRDHGGVDAAARQRDRERKRRRPPPRARRPQATMRAQQQPRQRGVAEQRHRRAGAEDDHVRVENHQQRSHRVGDPPRATDQRVEQPDRAPRGNREQQAEPQPLHQPRAEADEAAEREQRAHRQQVADVLPALHVAEVAGRRPHGRDVRQEPHGVRVQVDLRVRRRQPRALRERQSERK